MIKFLLDEKLEVHRHVGWDVVRERVKGNKPVYIDIIDPKKEDTDNLRDLFHFHHTNLKDNRNFSGNPRIEEYRNYVFTLIKSIVPNKAGDNYKSYDIYLFLGESYIITIHDIELEIINEALETVLSDNELKELKSGYVYYTILDNVVDSYFPVLQYWSDRVDDIEGCVFDSASGDGIVNTIISVRKEFLRLKRIAMPQKEVMYKLAHTDVNFIDGSTRIYLQDVSVHISDIYNSIEEQRDILSNLMDAHFSKTSAELNEIMKRLTIMSTIFMPMTFIVGVYGMNFRNMPELDWRYGYYAILVIMLIAAVGLVIYFKRKKWF